MQAFQIRHEGAGPEDKALYVTTRPKGKKMKSQLPDHPTPIYLTITPPNVLL